MDHDRHSGVWTPELRSSLPDRRCRTTVRRPQRERERERERERKKRKKKERERERPGERSAPPVIDCGDRLWSAERNEFAVTFVATTCCRLMLMGWSRPFRRISRKRSKCLPSPCSSATEPLPDAVCRANRTARTPNGCTATNGEHGRARRESQGVCFPILACCFVAKDQVSAQGCGPSAERHRAERHGPRSSVSGRVLPNGPRGAARGHGREP